MSKIRNDFGNKVVLKLKLPKTHFNKHCAPKFLLFIGKENQKDSADFYIEARQASEAAYNPGGWL